MRSEKGLSVRQLSQATGMSPTYLSNIENGRYLFPTQYTQAFVKALGLSGRERHLLYDVLAMTRDNRFEDIDEYLSRNETARNCIRLIILQENAPSVWDRIIQFLNGYDRDE